MPNENRKKLLQHAAANALAAVEKNIAGLARALNIARYAVAMSGAKPAGDVPAGIRRGSIDWARSNLIMARQTGSATLLAEAACAIALMLDQRADAKRADSLALPKRSRGRPPLPRDAHGRPMRHAPGESPDEKARQRAEDELRALLAEAKAFGDE